jgi:hypothetical protein
MNQELSRFAARLRSAMARPIPPQEFDALALELFALQFQCNPAYGSLCKARRHTPATVEHWTQIPFVPTGAFKELELSCIPPEERTAVFHSSGTTEQRPGRHFHCAESLAVYEASLWQWFRRHCDETNEYICLTPDSKAAPRSSLVHMFETVRQHFRGEFVGGTASDGMWTVDFDTAVRKLEAARAGGRAVTVLGTAFSFVHLLDFLAERNLQLALPVGSRVMETGGYKNRSRVLPKGELHALITQWLGVGRDNILCEYGMSELSSQAYEAEFPVSSPGGQSRVLRFPPWARALMISPETGGEVAEGETGIIRVLDLANVFSVAAVQTEDLGIRRGDGFELLGRAQRAEPRGCSLMTA